MDNAGPCVLPLYAPQPRKSSPERIDELQNKKKDLFNAVIEVDQMRKEITKEELLSLFEAPPEPRHQPG